MQSKEDYVRYFDELRTRIAIHKLHQPTPIYGLIRICITILLYVLGIVFMGGFPLFVSVLYFYIIIVEFSYISHDLIHGQYFQNKYINRFFSHLVANICIGLSHSWWKDKHNVGHHIFTNSDIHDTDIRDYDEIFTRNPGKIHFFHKYKSTLFWGATILVYFSLVFHSYRYTITEKKYGEFLLSLIPVILIPFLFTMYYGIIFGILGVLLLYVCVGVHLAFVFMVNHIGMPVIEGEKIRQYAWLDLQTRTSRNITGGWLIHHIFGGLNKQIEHHLFPGISRKYTPTVSREVRDFCREKNISYHEVSFLEALREIYLTLKTNTPL